MSIVPDSSITPAALDTQSGLTVTHLSVRIGRKRIVAPTDFHVEAGQCLAVVGCNGAGKTTLVRALAGLLPMQGEVWLEGQPLHRLSVHARSNLIGYVAQSFLNADVQLTVFELLLLAQNGAANPSPAAFGALTTPQAYMARAEYCIKELNLQAFAHRKPADMSGGQRQMVALALALVRHPRLLLLDEPTSALDLNNQLHLLEHVRDYTRRHGTTTLMVLHDLNQVCRYADRVILLDQGRAVAQGTASETLTEQRLRDIYRVDCRVLDLGDGQRAIYPLGRVVGSADTAAEATR